MQRQLSIFDTLQPIDTALAKIRPGDWVKLKKDAAGAIDWSPGEVLQIESIDPASGRARFWNDRVQEWGYLRSADMALTVSPLKVLKKQPIARDTESNCQHSQTDTVARVEVDTESIWQPEKLDTESTPEPVEFDSVSGPVATYRPRGTARGGEYFRFSYRAGGKMKHLHIPGGNTGSVLAQSRATEVMELAAAGVPSLEICDRIKSWSKRNHLET